MFDKDYKPDDYEYQPNAWLSYSKIEKFWKEDTRKLMVFQWPKAVSKVLYMPRKKYIHRRQQDCMYIASQNFIQLH